MTTGMMIYLLICGLIGLALVVLALMSLIETGLNNGLKLLFWMPAVCFLGWLLSLWRFWRFLG